VPDDRPVIPQQPQRPPRKHLMVPGQPRPQQRYSTSLSTVQKWVMSTLVAITILHLAVGIAVAAYFAPRADGRIGLLVISGIFGLIAFAAARLIHRVNPLSPWLLLGLVPAVVGALLIFR